MKFFLKKKVDYCHNNLLTINKVAIIIPDKYDKASFQDIILAHWHPKANNSVFQTISLTIADYMSLYYILFFLYEDLS